MKSVGMRIIPLALVTAASVFAAPQKAVYSVAPDKSQMEVHVYKGGFFQVFGHDHLIMAKEISGRVQFDGENIENSTVRLKVDAKSLRVIDPGETQEDRQSVQATMMGDKVLDVARFPTILFKSASVSLVKKTSTGWNLALIGMLQLHGVEKQVSLPIHLSTEGNQLQARGEVSLLQTEYGITPIKVGGGAVKVKDRLKVSFTMVASATNP